MAEGDARSDVHSFSMPGEERFFFRHLQPIAVTVYLLVVFLIFGSNEGDWFAAALKGVFFVGPFYALVLFYRRRFVEWIDLDFGNCRITFQFPDGRGRVSEDFSAVSHVKFQSYLTFVMGETRIMVKRPQDKKGTLRILKKAFQVNQGWLVG